VEEKLDFSLPEKKNKKPVALGLVLFLLLIVVVLALVILILQLRAGPVAKEAVAPMLSSQQTEQLAGRLAGRNLYDRAADAWKDYLAGAGITDEQRARILFQIGTLLEKAGKYDEAIEYFYRSEMTSKLKELAGQINSHISDCFRRLGKFSALRYELMDRTAFGEAQGTGGKAVAEIGVEKITEADLDAAIEKNIDNQLQTVASFMTAEQLASQKQRILEQYRNRNNRMQFLQGWLAQEVLYRQALEEKLTERPAVKELLNDLAKSVLSQQLMNEQLASKINITQTDIETYYEANKDKFLEPQNKEDPNSPKRQKSLDEVTEQLMSKLTNRKRQEVQQQYIDEMMDKYGVIIHSSAFAPAEPNQ
jgi:hypothetical protein